jgi:DNA-binding PadR family transcriptional regulator
MNAADLPPRGERTLATLQAVAEAGSAGLTTAELAEHLDEPSQKTFSAVVSYLRNQGYLSGTRGTSQGRITTWRITEEGQQRIAELLAGQLRRPAAVAAAAERRAADPRGEARSAAVVEREAEARAAWNAVSHALVGTRRSDDLESVTHVIERGIPVPQAGYRRSMYAETASRMEVGDSVVLDTRRKANCLCHQLRENGGRAAQRGLPDGRTRVWRVK